MQIINCPECGEEILVVPDLKKMAEALNNHVEKHEIAKPYQRFPFNPLFFPQIT